MILLTHPYFNVINLILFISTIKIQDKKFLIVKQNFNVNDIKKIHCRLWFNFNIYKIFLFYKNSIIFKQSNNS